MNWIHPALCILLTCMACVALPATQSAWRPAHAVACERDAAGREQAAGPSERAIARPGAPVRTGARAIALRPEVVLGTTEGRGALPPPIRRA